MIAKTALAHIQNDMLVPQLQDDGTFSMILVKKDDKYPIISNDCGPVLITRSGIILSKKLVLTTYKD